MNMEVLSSQSVGVAGRQTMFQLQNGVRTAACESRSARTGWEVRLLVQGDVWYADRCSTWPQVIDTAERWKRALLAKGWHRPE